MKILLVYPQYPDTFWSFKYALGFIGKKACLPPLGLLTVAALLPARWEKRLVDLNVDCLDDKTILWADYVFISAMSIQRRSAETVIDRCRRLGVKTVAGGPLFTNAADEFPHVDHLVLNEGEVTLPRFVRDVEDGATQRIYASDERADITRTPAPLWGLVNLKRYASVNIQYSRGCPFDCEFCDITGLFGRKPRTKSRKQVILELEALYGKGWRGSVFFVDDNFIADKKKLKREVLPAIIEWQERHAQPFSFYTEASIDLSDDDELVNLMVWAGFREVFIGIETPHEESLHESSKFHNKERDLLACVKKLQNAGLQVHAGFIVGFDNDPPLIFDKLISFIQESGIATAMVGMLIALRGTRLYQRLVQEGRLLGEASGDNTDISINFIPRMNTETLIAGYAKVLATIYTPRHYYSRVITFLKEYGSLRGTGIPLDSGRIGAFFKSLVYLGILGKERLHFWRLLLWSLFNRPRLLPVAVTLAIYGFHFRKVAERVAGSLAVPPSKPGVVS